MSIKKQKGFGLVELMLGLFLGTCLLTLMIRHYLTTKKHSVNTANVLAEAYDQELISELIRTSIRQAGFTPCAPIRRLIIKDEHGQPRTEAIRLNVGDKKALQISRMSEDFTILQETQSRSQFLVDAGNFLKADTRVLVADCFHAEIKTIQSVKGEGNVWRLTLKNPLHYTYTSPIYIGEWLNERYFVDTNSKGQSALFYQLNHAEELSSQIKGFSVKLERRGAKCLVSIDFFLDQGKIGHIDVAVRV